ncbi:MAG: helix-turn-helix protein [Phormidesmis priestleyi Ana]|uniref:Helix-turn-helix protein n=1 Tax=Phormidesmis priestleyi Ana TaxID=1666911 RepID=A0A0P7YQR3_9CYAN|nr:MAG: helix-turn-helix protein [Phormidesmis priestleyi Ana]
MKLFCHAFETTLKEFDNKGLYLAEKAGVSTGIISHFRNDAHAITTDSLEKLLAVLPDEAFALWLSQVTHNRHLEEFVESPIALNSFVHKLDNQGAAALLGAIADRLRESPPLKSSAKN